MHASACPNSSPLGCSGFAAGRPSQKHYPGAHPKQPREKNGPHSLRLRLRGGARLVLRFGHCKGPPPCGRACPRSGGCLGAVKRGVIVPVVNARVLVRPGLVFHLAAAVLVTVETPQRGFRAPPYTPRPRGGVSPLRGLSHTACQNFICASRFKEIRIFSFFVDVLLYMHT